MFSFCLLMFANLNKCSSYVRCLLSWLVACMWKIPDFPRRGGGFILFYEFIMFVFDPKIYSIFHSYFFHSYRLVFVVKDVFCIYKTLCKMLRYVSSVKINIHSQSHVLHPNNQIKYFIYKTTTIHTHKKTLFVFSLLIYAFFLLFLLFAI